MRACSRDSAARRDHAIAQRESLSQNYPFVDGNKRVAITVTAAFFRVNGYRLEFDGRAAYQFLMSLYERGCFGFAELEEWLRRHAVPTNK